jgi:nitroimidazol reductase NimA-like FMN-containing flavoprotein (pyridoxamine 5'-phosphate oxidase superfamily)
VLTTGPAELTARAIIDANLYMVLATADGTGRPWSSPVYFAHDRYAEFLWVSAPEAEHSRNIATRPHVSIVIFDSHAPIGTGQGVYISATAEQVGSDNLTRGIEAFSQRSIGHGGAAWTVRDVQAESGLRLYRAAAESYSILAKDGQPDHRIPAHLELNPRRPH